MSALPVSEPKTIDDLLALEAETGGRFEIVDGEFVETSVSRDSSFVNSRFNRFLGEYVERERIGEVYDGEMSFALPESTRKADASVVLNQKLPTGDVSHFTGPPDVVVEVASPSDKWTNIRNKIQEWLDAGAQLVWLATPSASEITIFRRGKRPRIVGEGDVLDGEDVLPGFSVEVSRFFPAREEARQELS